MNFSNRFSSGGFSWSVYAAGLGTAALAVLVGFGGGVFLASSVESETATPAAGMSRIERMKREEPKAAQAVETTGSVAGNAEDVSYNPLAEGRPFRAAAKPEPANINAVPASEALHPATARPMIMPVAAYSGDAGRAAQAPVAKPASVEIANPAAVQSIASSPRDRRSRKRGQRLETNASMTDDLTPRQERQERYDRSSRRKAARSRDRDPAQDYYQDLNRGDLNRGEFNRADDRRRNDAGEPRYTVRSAGRRAPDAAEVAYLKRVLRDRRETSGSALSFQSAPLFSTRSIFPD